MSEPIPPINCPLQAVSAGRGDGSRSQARFDETCSQEQDVGIHGATALQMMRLEDVFVTDSGFALNRTHLFVRNGCPHFPGKVTYDAEHMVHELPTAVFNWAHQPASNFYHFLIEIFPLFLVAAPLMPSPLRQLPVLVRGGQVGSNYAPACMVQELPAAVINWAGRANPASSSHQLGAAHHPCGSFKPSINHQLPSHFQF
ncbi:unnamed protein product [Closterium sp. NIES-54]